MKSKLPALKINIYESDGNKDYGYEVVCGESTVIKYNYKGKVHTQRVLSDFESDLLKKQIKAIKLNFLSEQPDMRYMQEPSITTLVEIKSQFSKVSIKWETNDELGLKKSFIEINKFIETVHEMLAVDFSNLNMPTFR